MNPTRNFAIRINNGSHTKNLIRDLLHGFPEKEFKVLHGKRGLLYARSEIDRFMDEEERHDFKILTQDSPQSLKSMSSGEQKKALLHYLLNKRPDYLVLVNPFDNLDVDTQDFLKEKLLSISKSTILIQLINRLDDILPSTTDFFTFYDNVLQKYPSSKSFWDAHNINVPNFTNALPPPIDTIETGTELIRFNDVSVSFNGRKVLDAINWTIKKGEFWQLIGPNGSGKTTLLSMITGDSHKGYGEDLVLFGQRKGSGESVWELKKKIGYFTPAMMDKFSGYHSLEHMMVSGFYDSIGLYNNPTDQKKRLAGLWLKLLGLYDKKNVQFVELTTGQKRLIMTARAMVKHPPLLILDEPTAGLDDENARLFIDLVNKISQESETTIIFVSHRRETGLQPQFEYILEAHETGSTGYKSHENY